ncbi:MAG TPA: DUF2207 domain-containing protein [Egibacteraceae bacterium]|nr:DUF2207 domain-containing protein [Egibacteraceae bacterium]
MIRLPRRLRRAGVLAALSAGLALWGAAPAAAQVDDGWIIETFDVTIDVAPDGSLRVIEEIAVDFRDLQRHGIYRDIPVRYRLPADTDVALPDGRQADEFVRAIDIGDISVSSSAPDDVEATRPGPGAVGGHLLRLRIGDPDRTVTGRQSYRIAYTVRGALNSFDTHEELYWNAVGSGDGGWPVPIEQATATVRGPQIAQTTCFRGAFGATALCEAAASGSDASFAAHGLGPREGLTVVVGFAPGAVEVPEPLLIERFSFSAAMAGSPFAIPLTVLTALLAFGSVTVLAFRQGRDRIARGAVSVDGRVEGQSGDGGRRRPLFAPRAVPVQFRPPAALRPGQLGLIVDERVDPVDLSATIVDLAVRGHLKIAEIESKTLWISRADWRLTRTENAEDKLLGYESRLLKGLFSDGDEVDLSDLKGKFAGDYQAVKSQIYNDGVKRRWFNKRPDHTRSLWLGLGIGAAVVGVGLFVAATVLFTRMALAAVPIALGGLALVIVHRWMPHRTARGSRLLTETLGFREFIVTAESGRMGYAEDANLFVEYLPYAIVFGAVDKWARAFAHLGAAATAGVGVWYYGPHMGAGPDLSRLSAGLSDFSSKVGGTLPTAPPSSGGSGGGFSGGGGGGGFGGGGGGSW